MLETRHTKSAPLNENGRFSSAERAEVVISQEKIMVSLFCPSGSCLWQNCVCCQWPALNHLHNDAIWLRLHRLIGFIYHCTRYQVLDNIFAYNACHWNNLQQYTVNAYKNLPSLAFVRRPALVVRYNWHRVWFLKHCNVANGSVKGLYSITWNFKSKYGI